MKLSRPERPAVRARRISTTWLPRRAGDAVAVLPPELERRVEHANDQFLSDIPNWSNLRYTATP